MPANLLNEFVKGSLNSRSGAGSVRLGRELSGWQAQVERDDCAFAPRALLNQGFQMKQFWPEDAEAFFYFLNLGIVFFFNVRGFVGLVTDVNVHFSKPRKREKSPVKPCPLQK